MSNFFGSIWWLVVTLGLLVTFHEFGHFWVARRFGIKVLRFSVGFGRPLWRRLGRDGTEYMVAAIPLGGYVKFLDEREGDVAPGEVDQAFNRKSVGARMAVVAAGPVFNIIFAVFAFWLMFVVGKHDYLPIVGRAEGIALASGFKPGDQLKEVDGEAVRTWTDATLYLAKAAIDRSAVPVVVLDARGETHQRSLDLATVAAGATDLSPLSIGMLPNHLLLEPVIDQVLAGQPAEAAGIKPGDRIERVGTVPIESWDEVGPALRALDAGEPVAITLLRDGNTVTVTATPRTITREDGSKAVGIGIGPRMVAAKYDTVVRYGPLAAIPVAVGETWRMTRETLALLKRMVLGQASLKNVSGPVSIAQFANSTAQMGLAWFCWFLAMMSLSIAIMNLLPIPILDGGHLLYYLIEAVKGSPVSEKALAFGQYVGLTLLAGLMGLAFYNDIVRLVS